MLLPSAIPCDASLINSQSLRPQRPKLPSFDPYQPSLSSRSAAGAISSSCRTLQMMLGCPPPPKTPASRNIRDNSLNPFDIMRIRDGNTQIRPTIPRGKNKRGRDEFEEDKENDMMDYEHSEQYSTPKRQRRVPLLMPLGLSAEDFHALEVPVKEEEDGILMPSFLSPTRDSDEDSGYGPSPPTEDQNWTMDDDRVLVETVLEKLKLSKREWNDCARKLGKNRDSIGRRWKFLVGEGNVGLRRGRRISRTSLDIGSW